MFSPDFSLFFQLWLLPPSFYNSDFIRLLHRAHCEQNTQFINRLLGWKIDFFLPCSQVYGIFSLLFLCHILFYFWKYPLGKFVEKPSRVVRLAYAPQEDLKTSLWCDSLRLRHFDNDRKGASIWIIDKFWTSSILCLCCLIFSLFFRLLL